MAKHKPTDKEFKLIGQSLYSLLTYKNNTFIIGYRDDIPHENVPGQTKHEYFVGMQNKDKKMIGAKRSDNLLAMLYSMQEIARANENAERLQEIKNRKNEQSNKDNSKGSD